MSKPLARPEDIAQARDLDVHEYMEQIETQDHPVPTLKPLFDNRAGRWVQTPDNMLLSVLYRLPSTHILIPTIGIWRKYTQNALTPS